MTFKKIVEIIRDLSNRHRLVRSFHTGLSSQNNDSMIAYPSVRLEFPYTANVVDEDKITFSFNMGVSVNSIENEYSIEKNTNYLIEDDNNEEICTEVTDETKMRERAIRILCHFIERLESEEVSANYDYFDISFGQIQGVERAYNDFITAAEVSVNITVNNDYRCESEANTLDSIWMTDNEMLAIKD